jgi:hypothetical protein
MSSSAAMSVNSADDISQKPTDEEVKADRDEGQAGKFFADAGESRIPLVRRLQSSSHLARPSSRWRREMVLQFATQARSICRSSTGRDSLFIRKINRSSIRRHSITIYDLRALACLAFATSVHPFTADCGSDVNIG